MLTGSKRFSLLVVTFIAGSGIAFAATDVQKFTFSGAQVNVGFFGSGEVTCADGTQGFVSAFGSLQGAEQISRSTGTPQTIANGVFVEIDSFFNTCTNLALSGSGGVANALTPPDKKLMSASLVGTASVQDFGSGAIIPVTFNVAVQGTGTISQSKSNGHSKTLGDKGGPIMITQNHSANSNRSGTATGTISVDGVAIDPQFFFSFLNLNDNSSLTVSKLP